MIPCFSINWHHTVHPHARGDNGQSNTKSRPLNGSPPRLWGQCPHRPAVVAPCRCTPTPVGTIKRRASAVWETPVHPHARGDNAHWDRIKKGKRGTPPRPWGQYGNHQATRSLCRFTPTPVGTMTPHSHSPSITAVHPHARGDNLLLAYMELSTIGSPPRSWGQYCDLRSVQTEIRFTPTPVGTMSFSTSLLLLYSVHPHARGDNGNLIIFADNPTGSPPRSWGQCN